MADCGCPPRGLLDLMIARLGELSLREKIVLCKLYNTEQDLIEKSKNDIEMIIGRLLASWQDIDSVRAQAERDEATARLRGINWVSWHSPEYPPLLREIYDPPVALFFRGSLPNPGAPLAGIVGTRKPSPQAAVQAFDIAKGLAQGGVSVVSGLALGIDAMAHRGNIEGGSPTVAVLGSGLDEVYPSSNRLLARRILETGGTLLSEYPPGTGPRKWHFPARNRIISGLSRCVVIAEAPQKSGALITARFAIEQNRDLWVASCGIAMAEASLFDRAGTVKLAEEGAGIIFGASDILQMWGMGMVEAAGITREHDRGIGDAVSSLACSLGIKME